MYKSIKELPPSVRTHLPQSAQELYRATYNRNWEKLAAGKTTDTEQIEAEAHEAARLAVKAEFHQDDEGRWHHEPVGDEMKQREDVGEPAARGEEDSQFS